MVFKQVGDFAGRTSLTLAEIHVTVIHRVSKKRHQQEK